MIPLQGRSKIISQDEIIAIERKGAVVWKDGRPVSNTTQQLKFRGNVQPVQGKDLLLVEEGDRLKEQLWIWTENRLNKGSLEINDMVMRLGVNYQVQTVENWGSYTRSRAMRIDVGPDRTPGEQAIS